ncbi:hypothetical protein Scep_014204 [Stephania cephalantha]|uniref:Uncharacterized protein n=1 Tax=Stephania cephalantha TaxID=152367 RepID=A0AAP0J2M8_9MAGN
MPSLVWVARNVAKVEKKRESAEDTDGADGQGAAGDNEGIDADEIVDEHQQ